MSNKKTTPTRPSEPAPQTHDLIGIKRYGSNDIGLVIMKDGVPVEIARDAYAIIEGKLRNELYRICFLEV